MFEVLHIYKQFVAFKKKINKVYTNSLQSVVWSVADIHTIYGLLFEVLTTYKLYAVCSLMRSGYINNLQSVVWSAPDIQTICSLLFEVLQIYKQFSFLFKVLQIYKQFAVYCLKCSRLQTMCSLLFEVFQIYKQFTVFCFKSSR